MNILTIPSYEQSREAEELIHDDCHSTPLGQRLIAEALAEVLD